MLQSPKSFLSHIRIEDTYFDVANFLILYLLSCDLDEQVQGANVPAGTTLVGYHP